MGYYGGVIIPGPCEDIPACGHYEAETGEIFCPQPADNETIVDFIMSEENEKKFTKPFNSCDEHLKAYPEEVPDFSVSRPWFSKNDVDGKNTHTKNKENFNAELEEHGIKNFENILVLAKKHHIEIEFSCCKCAECIDEIAECDANFQKYLEEIS